MTNPISADALHHVENLHKWAAKAAARGDMESSERLQAAAHRVFDKAVVEAAQSDAIAGGN